VTFRPRFAEIRGEFSVVTLTEGVLPSGGRIKENRDGASLRSTGECFVGSIGISVRQSCSNCRITGITEYLVPDQHAAIGYISSNVDHVFAFGVSILEILSGKGAVQQNL
jgi:hypothetical protein